MRRACLGLLLGSLLGGLVLVGPAQAHSYADPTLASVLDEVQPTPLPAGVTVQVRPSVIDELVLTNPTATPLEVLAIGGEPFLRVSARGVEANLASPDWHSTSTPEGDRLVPRGPASAPAWARVSRGSSWSVFDSRLRPPLTVPADVRTAGRVKALVNWTIPLRYGDQPRSVTGHVEFRPVLGGLVVAVTSSPVTVTPLQGGLPGLFLRADKGVDVAVRGRDGLPYLRFESGRVLANTASASWRDDARVKGQPTTAQDQARGWIEVARGQTYSWLDPRLRYPEDQPPQPDRSQVVQRWEIPVSVGGRTGAVVGTVEWVTRAAAFGARAETSDDRSPWLLALPLTGIAAVLAGFVVARRRTARKV